MQPCSVLSNGKTKAASHVIEFAPVLQVLVHTSSVAVILNSSFSAGLVQMIILFLL